MRVWFFLALILGLSLIGSGVFDLFSGESELWIGMNYGSVSISDSVDSSDRLFASYVGIKFFFGFSILCMAYFFNKE